MVTCPGIRNCIRTRSDLKYPEPEPGMGGVWVPLLPGVCVRFYHLNPASPNQGES